MDWTAGLCHFPSFLVQLLAICQRALHGAKSVAYFVSSSLHTLTELFHALRGQKCHPIEGAEMKLIGRRLCEMQQVAMRRDNTFGLTGRARRIKETGEGVRGDVQVRLRGGQGQR